MAVGGFILFYTLLFTTNNIKLKLFCIIETRAKLGNPTSYCIFQAHHTHTHTHTVVIITHYKCTSSYVIILNQIFQALKV